VLNAFIRDLARIQNENCLHVILAIRGIPIKCSDLAPLRQSLIDTIRNRLDQSGIELVGVDQKLDMANGGGLPWLLQLRYGKTLTR
jgi:hypothetical protein